MTTFSTENLIQNLGHDDLLVRCVCIEMLSHRHETDIEVTRAILDAFEKHGFANTFTGDVFHFQSEHDSETLERVLQLIERLPPHRSPSDNARTSLLWNWCLKADVGIALPLADRIRKSAGNDDAQKASAEFVVERLHFRNKCATLPAETLRSMLDELIEDCASTMAKTFPDRETLLIQDIVPYLVKTNAIPPDEFQKWLSYAIDAEVEDFASEFRLSTALHIALETETMPDFATLAHNLDFEFDWIYEPTRDLFVRFGSDDDYAKLRELFQQDSCEAKDEISMIFDRIASPELVAPFLDLLKKESDEIHQIFLCYPLAAAGTEEGVAAAMEALDRFLDDAETISTFYILYAWHTLEGKSHPELEDWRDYLMEEAAFTEELANTTLPDGVNDLDDLLHALEDKGLLPPDVDFETASEYNPDHDQPDWDPEDEDMNMHFVREYILANEPHVENVAMHASIHTILENQFALGEDDTPAVTLRRLMSEGLGRHDALHAIGSILSEMMFYTLKEQKEMSEEEYHERLEDLNATRWLSEHNALQEAPLTERYLAQGGTYQSSSKKIGRNDPCPCGSGKKYKNCCMKFSN